MKIVIHIGMEKTGTTSVQRFVREQSSALREQRILVPESLGAVPSRSLVMMGIEPGTVERNHQMAGLTSPEAVAAHVAEVSSRFAVELESTHCERVLLTNELLSNRFNTVARIERFGAWVRRYSDDVEVVVYLRRQDKMFLAMYSTLIKVGFSGPFAVPNVDDGATPTMNKYDYESVLRAWADVFGRENLRVRVFEPEQLVDGDVVVDFAEVLGVPELARASSIARENESFDLVSLEFLRRFNRHVPYMANGAPNPLRRGLLPGLEDHAGGRPKLEWHGPVSRQEFMERFEAGNAAVAREYLGREDGVLFRDRSFDGALSDAPALDVDGAVEIAAHLWTTQQRRLRELERRVAHLESEPPPAARGREASGESTTTPRDLARRFGDALGAVRRRVRRGFGGR